MPNYNDAQGVADLLSQFDFNIISEGPGDFSTQHRKYSGKLEQDSHDGQTPEREDERADGDAEH